MKKSLTIIFLGIILTMGSLLYAATSTLNFSWQQDAANMTALKSWKIYKSETQGSGYALFYEIMYNGNQQQEYTGTTTLEQPLGTVKTYYFVCRAVGNNGLESGDSNEVSAVINWTTPAVPVQFKLIITN